MSLDAKAALKRLESSPEYREWRSRNRKAYLSSAFLMLNGESSWLLSYYDRKSNLMSSFLMGEEISLRENEEVFKEKKAAVKALDMGRVRIGCEKALAAAARVFGKDGKEAFKRIAVLQSLDMGQVWNITFLLRDMSTVNFKIDAGSGKILSQKALSLFESKAG